MIIENKMNEFIEYVPLVLQGIGGIVILATVIVKLTPGGKDDQKMGEMGDKFFKYVSCLPTFGINPRTKRIEEAYRELKEQKK